MNRRSDLQVACVYNLSSLGGGVTVGDGGGQEQIPFATGEGGDYFLHHKIDD